MSRSLRIVLEVTPEERFALLAVAEAIERAPEAPLYGQAARTLRRALEELPTASGAPRRARASRHRASSSSARTKLLGAVLTVRPDAWLHVLVSLSDVRRLLGWPKALFDGTVLALAREGAVTLHEHDHPSGLTPAERASLVADDLGRHYIGLALEPEAERYVAR